MKRLNRKYKHRLHWELANDMDFCCCDSFTFHQVMASPTVIELIAQESTKKEVVQEILPPSYDNTVNRADEHRGSLYVQVVGENRI